MNVIIILIIASLGLALSFLAGFIWAVRSGQYDDTHTPSVRFLLDDETSSRTRQSFVIEKAHGDAPDDRSISTPVQNGEVYTIKPQNRP